MAKSFRGAGADPVMMGAAVVGAWLGLTAIWRRLPHLPARMQGSKGTSLAKALHVTMEARPGKEKEVEQLLLEIRQHAEDEPNTRPWFGLRRSANVFEIFESFPDEAGRKAHLSGKGAALLMKRSNALLVRPAVIRKLDVLVTKIGKGEGQGIHY